MPEGEQEEQEIENLFEKNNEGELPQSTKGNMQVEEAQRVPKKLDPRRNTPKHIIITLAKMKDRRDSEKQQEKRTQLPTKEFPLDYQLISQKKPYRQEGAGKKYLKS